MKSQNNFYISTLIATICVFFFWGFAAAGNALLIPALKETFHLSQVQAQLVEFSFYLAYFAGSFSYFIISFKKPGWLLKFGFKNIMILGLLVSAVGTVLLMISAGMDSYLFLLGSLFVIAFGFSFQQIVANPLLVALGGEKMGAHRLILAGAVNSFGNTIAPLLLSYFLFGDAASHVSGLSLASTRPLFIVITALYLLFAFIFYKISFPENLQSTKTQEKNMDALKYPQLVLGMIAIFCYVGSEVTIQGNLPALVASENIIGLPAKDAVHYFSLFGGSLLIGRWTGALFNFKLPNFLRTLLLFIVPCFTFGIVLIANWIKGSDLKQLLDYIPFLFIITVTLGISGSSPQKILGYSSLLSLLLIASSFLVKGKMSMYCIICVASFTALMWPCIFMLAIKGLGKYTQQGSSLLIMMILGGAIFPPLQGLLADMSTIGIHNSFWLPAVGFAYIGWYALSVDRLSVPTSYSQVSSTFHLPSSKVPS